MLSFQAVAAHAATGAALGMLLFLGLAALAPTRGLILAAPEPTPLMLAGVIVSLFAVASALTGFLFVATTQR
jgi:hypothetical protein